MTDLRTTLLVVYTPKLDACRRFYADLGLEFVADRHAGGPEHYAARLADGTVFELYPASTEQETGDVGLGFRISAAMTRHHLEPGQHLLRDPDGRTIRVHAV